MAKTSMTIQPSLLRSVLLGVVIIATTGFKPFFDKNPATRFQPNPPEVTELDLDVLLLCGSWGAPVEAAHFEKILLHKSHKKSLQRIKKALNNKIYRQASDNRDFVGQLKRVWFEQKGFAHVFCGEPGHGRDLGGLHYAPRYWQAQNRGWAGFRALKPSSRNRLRKCKAGYVKQKTNQDIYNISVSFKNPKNRSNGVKCLSGYHRKMDAEKLLIAGTQAFKQANKRVGKNSKEACLVETKVTGIAPHYSTLVIKRRALRTFYAQPDKKPFCRKNKRNFRACLCSSLGR